jgi:hypothetical protein
MSRFLLAFLVFSLLQQPAVAQDALTLQDLMATRVQLPRADCALFPAAAQLDTLGLHKAAVEPSRFTPTRQQVEMVEQQLEAAGISAIRQPLTPPDSANLAYIQAHLPVYKRQYFGFYNAQHQPCLFIQLFEGDNLGDWLHHWLLILDGGPSVWEVYYNLDTRRFYGLGYHGLG